VTVILVEDLLALAAARLDDVEILLQNDRVDVAEYLCGYVVELALKARICRTLNWPGFPETRKEFENYASFRTHKLEVLLSLSGHEQRIKAEHLYEWSNVENWDPAARYRRVGQADLVQVAVMWASAEKLLKVL
jgi:hypothetical protein